MLCLGSCCVDLQNAAYTELFRSRGLPLSFCINAVVATLTRCRACLNNCFKTYLCQDRPFATVSLALDLMSVLKSCPMLRRGGKIHRWTPWWGRRPMLETMLDYVVCRLFSEDSSWPCGLSRRRGRGLSWTVILTVYLCKPFMMDIVLNIIRLYIVGPARIIIMYVICTL